MLDVSQGSEEDGKLERQIANNEQCCVNRKLPFWDEIVVQTLMLRAKLRNTLLFLSVMSRSAVYRRTDEIT